MVAYIQIDGWRGAAWNKVALQRSAAAPPASRCTARPQPAPAARPAPTRPTRTLPREELFNMINALPTCYEVVSGKAQPGQAVGSKRKAAAAPAARVKQAKHVSGGPRGRVQGGPGGRAQGVVAFAAGGVAAARLRTQAPA